MVRKRRAVQINLLLYQLVSECAKFDHNMETKETNQEPGILSRLLSRLFRSRLNSVADGRTQPNVDLKLIADLQIAKNSPATSTEDLAIIDSWIITLQRYAGKIASGQALDKMDLADIEYIKKRALDVISK